MVFDIVLFNFRYSKQPILTEQAKPQDLPDKTSSYENFTQSKLNRFIHHDAKNRIQAPCKVSSSTDLSHSDRSIDEISDECWNSADEKITY